MCVCPHCNWTLNLARSTKRGTQLDLGQTSCRYALEPKWPKVKVTGVKIIQNSFGGISSGGARFFAGRMPFFTQPTVSKH